MSINVSMYRVIAALMSSSVPCFGRMCEALKFKNVSFNSHHRGVRPVASQVFGFRCKICAKCIQTAEPFISDMQSAKKASRQHRNHRQYRQCSRLVSRWSAGLCMDSKRLQRFGLFWTVYFETNW